MEQTVLITGAARGIGAAIAVRMAKEGYNVAVNCRNEEAYRERGGRETVEACRVLGAQAEGFFADVANFSECQTMVKAVTERFGRIDVLVNNAGITRDGLLVRMSEEQFDTVLEANLKSAFNMMRLVGAQMMKQRSGRIINISSVTGLYGNPGQANYCAAKAGVVGITLSAAKELGRRGITVNAVAPGLIQTQMTEEMPQTAREAILNSIALGRAGRPEEIAGAVAFLAGEDAAYITGQVLVVDGGLAM